jgi:hypothetical protein
MTATVVFFTWPKQRQVSRQTRIKGVDFMAYALEDRWTAIPAALPLVFLRKIHYFGMVS